MSHEYTSIAYVYVIIITNFLHSSFVLLSPFLFPLPPSFSASNINGGCPFTDHLVIAGSKVVAGGGETPASIFCGSKFPDEVVSKSPYKDFSAVSVAG